jgi:predicted lipoprotein with Yx(FWY)xxD motif
MKLRLATLILSTALLTACAGMGSAGAPAKLVDGVYVAPNGMTLYTLDRDTAGSGKSVCNGPCIVAWPALAAPADAKAEGDWSVVTRDDGSKQWAFRGKPLYFWSKDAKPGDKTGDGVNGVWHVVKP